MGAAIKLSVYMLPFKWPQVLMGAPALRVNDQTTEKPRNAGTFHHTVDSEQLWPKLTENCVNIFFFNVIVGINVCLLKIKQSN